MCGSPPNPTLQIVEPWTSYMYASLSDAHLGGWEGATHLGFVFALGTHSSTGVVHPRGALSSLFQHLVHGATPLQAQTLLSHTLALACTCAAHRATLPPALQTCAAHRSLTLRPHTCLRMPPPPSFSTHGLHDGLQTCGAPASL